MSGKPGRSGPKHSVTSMAILQLAREIMARDKSAGGCMTCGEAARRGYEIYGRNASHFGRYDFSDTAAEAEKAANNPVAFKRDAQIREEWKEFGRTWQKTVDGVVTERAQSNAGEKEQQLWDRKLKGWLRSGAQSKRAGSEVEMQMTFEDEPKSLPPEVSPAAPSRTPLVEYVARLLRKELRERARGKD